MKPISRLRANGRISIERSTTAAKPLILCYLSVAMKPPPPRSFAKAIGKNGWPDKVVIDKSGSNAAGAVQDELPTGYE